jgi:hypothetical protein
VGPAFEILSPGGDVTFRAGESVILGNGFSMEAGTGLEVVLDPLLAN